MRSIVFIGLFLPTMLLGQVDSTLEHRQDTQAVKPIHLLYEFAGGALGHAIPFWALGGDEYLRTGARPLGGVFLGIIGAGLGVAVIGNAAGNHDASYWGAVSGSVIGAFFAGPLYRYVGDHNDSLALQYAALALPPILMSILCYHLSL